ncbi:hypothetical protein LOC59_15730 [Arthrobacter sp. zg-Y916]|uniref:hypothetical protein n=1 Tax=Arthrobacter sp. zg-Y916 TaxID=2894190 RepID=UPI001E62614A|nr:hypothetical protein [Arthrobacter sp. zg-Y916]MCC9195087.1 hypothetical protein [Arthrobacter sp. zg-Y916]
MRENPTTRNTAPARLYFGMPLTLMAGLALLGLPRVILHDLHLLGERSPGTWILAIGPVLVWIAVTVLSRSPRPFLSVLVIGLIFGVLLVLTHQLLWTSAFAGNTSPVLNSPAARIAAIPSGLMTGAAIGAIGGLAALGLSAAANRRSRV